MRSSGRREGFGSDGRAAEEITLAPTLCAICCSMSACLVINAVSCCDRSARCATSVGIERLVGCIAASRVLRALIAAVTELICPSTWPSNWSLGSCCWALSVATAPFASVLATDVATPALVSVTDSSRMLESLSDWVSTPFVNFTMSRVTPACASASLIRSGLVTIPSTVPANAAAHPESWGTLPLMTRRADEVYVVVSRPLCTPYPAARPAIRHARTTRPRTRKMRCAASRISIPDAFATPFALAAVLVDSVDSPARTHRQSR